jgi:AraC-like DNA-binding protein
VESAAVLMATVFAPGKFAEADAWRMVGAGWRQLYGSFQKLGVSFEWHDFPVGEDFDWAKSFHPNSVEICLNLVGNGWVEHKGETAKFSPRTGGFYSQGREELAGKRAGGERHQFITVEFSRNFLQQHLRESAAALHPLVRAVFVQKEFPSGVSTPAALTEAQLALLGSLRRPPVMRATQFLWYQSKALELMMEFFFKPPEQEGFFCARQKHVAGERVKKVVEVLSERLVEPPTLEELGRLVGCSHFYLSRTFSAEMGMTIPQYIRQLRLERAAELLKEGKHNVTEVAMEVGYSSLSHFSAAFHEKYGCCPGLYSLVPKHAHMGSGE